MSSDLSKLLDAELNKIRKHLENDIDENNCHKQIIKDCEGAIINASACVEWLVKYYPKIYKGI